MPEGDALHRTAERLRVLEGQVVSAESPHPRAAALGIAERIDGRRVERVEAVGKNLLVTFDGGLVLRSHLRMRGRWRLLRPDLEPFGQPWLVLRTGETQAVLWNGPVLELGQRRSAALERLGPDIMREPPAIDAIVARLRAADPFRELGEALLDQRLVAGIGNMWKAEALFEGGLSPWRRLGETSDAALGVLLRDASTLMRVGRRRRTVYRRAGRPCSRCGTAVRSHPQGDEARMAYWCPTCQGGTGPAGS